MSEQTEFDVIVIGAGAAGEVLAGRTAASGLSTAIIESERAGGECSYWACIPSKALLKPDSVLTAAKRLEGSAAAVTGAVDASLVLATRDEAVNFYDDTSQAKWIESSGITLFRGFGRIEGDRKVVVSSDGGETQLIAKKAVVVATGSKATVPPIPGIDSIDFWTSREATSAKSVPRRLVVVGGGTVAVEMAQAWKSLGAEQVTLLVRGSKLVEREEPFASEALLKAFGEAGIDVRFKVIVDSFKKLHDGSIAVLLDDSSTVAADNVLVAIGRTANTKSIGLETVDVPVDRPIAVDDELRVAGNDWLYAVGDVNGRALLTHMGKYQARIASDVIAGKRNAAWADHNVVPGVTFTEPQIASVGLRFGAAKERFKRVREVTVPWSSVAGTFLSGIKEGTAQLVIDDERKVIVGATFVGPDAGEMLQAATNAIVAEVTLDKLWHAVPAYPTVSEIWLRLLEEYGF